ncbi:hypothetical protein EDB85DRAFT_304671 [Lactarius pseudohatsudake]|nr:hypothetical protein EDB85DRAFT_304671 [Lactarius pseudohatsudake]
MWKLPHLNFSTNSVAFGISSWLQRKSGPSTQPLIKCSFIRVPLHRDTESQFLALSAPTGPLDPVLRDLSSYSRCTVSSQCSHSSVEGTAAHLLFFRLFRSCRSVAWELIPTISNPRLTLVCHSLVPFDFVGRRNIPVWALSHEVLILRRQCYPPPEVIRLASLFTPKCLLANYPTLPSFLIDISSTTPSASCLRLRSCPLFVLGIVYPFMTFICALSSYPRCCCFGHASLFPTPLLSSSARDPYLVLVARFQASTPFPSSTTLMTCPFNSRLRCIWL